MKRAWLVIVAVALAVIGFSCSKSDEPVAGNKSEGGAISKPLYDLGDGVRESVSNLFWQYTFVHERLAGDDYHGAKREAEELDLKARQFVELYINKLFGDLEDVESDLLFESICGVGMSSENMVKADNIDKQRLQFSVVSEYMIEMIKNFGHNYEYPVVVMECSMAFDGKGACWLQQNEQLPVKNPYFGGAMLGCGSVTELLVGK